MVFGGGGGSAGTIRCIGVQRTLVITTVFVAKGFAVKSNLLLKRN